jgi:uncharacterized protein
MKFQHLNNGNEVTYIVVFDEGDEFTEGMLAFAKKQKLLAAHFSAIGAFRDVKVGWFDLDKQDYHQNQIDEQVEVLSLVGNVAQHDGKPKVHAHVVLGMRDATARGGHLLEAHIRPTLEVTVTESPTHLHRIYEKAYGLPLIHPKQTDVQAQGRS